MGDDMMAETRSIWQKFDQQLKHFEAKTPEPIPEDIKVPGFLFPQRRLMRLPSLFNDQTSKEMFKDEQQIAVKEDPKQFQVSLDTSLYRPDELKISVEANHEEKAEDGSKLVSRRFVRKYTLPQGCQAQTVTSNLSSDGVLMITAPKLALEDKTNVPIIQN